MLSILRTFPFVLLFLAFSAYTQNTYYLTEPQSSTEIKQQIKLNSNKDSLVLGYFKNDSLAYSYKLYHNKPSGIYKVYHFNGQLKFYGIFVNGKLDGIWKEFDNTSKLIVSGNYKLGLKDGIWYWFDKGVVEVYKNGIKDGRFRIDEGWTPRTLFLYKNGVLIKIKRKKQHSRFYN